MTLPKDITQVDSEIADDGSIVLMGHTASDDKTYIALVQPEWMLDGEKVEKPNAKVVGLYASQNTPVIGDGRK